MEKSMYIQKGVCNSAKKKKKVFVVCCTIPQIRNRSNIFSYKSATKLISLYYQMMTLLALQHPDFSLKFYNGSPEMLPVISAGLYRHSTFKGRKAHVY